MSTNDQVLPRSSAEEMGGENEESVEPSSSLINSFRNEIRWERSFELFFVLEGVVDLRVRHSLIRCVVVSGASEGE